MKVSICIPSYKRPVVKTLNYISNAKVYVDRKDYDDYVRSNNEENIVMCRDGIQGNVARVRNYILDEEFANGADAVCLMDDDLYCIEKFVYNEETNYAYEKKKIDGEEIQEFLEEYSKLCDEFGFKLWGVGLNPNSMGYRHYTPFSTTSVILGPFCVHLKNDIRYDEKLPLKEDYDLAIQHLNKYRGILRLNAYHYYCLQSENVGGCATQRNLIREKEQFELLQKKWGSDIVKIDITNKGRTAKIKKFDYNPIIHIPIKGI